MISPTYDLLWAVDHNNLTVLKGALQQCADPNACGNRSTQVTVLHKAADLGSLGMVEALLEFGAEADRQDRNRWTALHRASVKGFLPVIDALIRHGANLDLQTDMDGTALHLAAMAGQDRAVRRLIDAGAALDIRDNTQRTALHLAGCSGNARSIRHLLAAGADRDLADGLGETLLHWVARGRSPEVALEAIGDVDRKNLAGHDARSFASGEVLEIFDAYLVRRNLCAGVQTRSDTDPDEPGPLAL